MLFMLFFLLFLPLPTLYFLHKSCLSRFATEINREMFIQRKFAGGCTFLFGIYPGLWLHHLPDLDYNAKLGLILSRTHTQVQP